MGVASACFYAAEVFPWKLEGDKCGLAEARPVFDTVYEWR